MRGGDEKSGSCSTDSEGDQSDECKSNAREVVDLCEVPSVQKEFQKQEEQGNDPQREFATGHEAAAAESTTTISIRLEHTSNRFEDCHRRTSLWRPWTWFRAARIGTTSIVPILVDPGLTKQEFSSCIAQICSPMLTTAPPTSQLFSSMNSNPASVVGLFRESDGIFIPLSAILSNPLSYSNDVFSIARPIQSSQPSKSATSSTKISRLPIFFFTFVVLGYSILFFQNTTTTTTTHVYLQFDIGYMILRLILAPFLFFDAMIDMACRRIYRYGPVWIGWDGASLSYICSQITYQKEAFWYHHADLCEDLYASKEASFLQNVKIGIYIVLPLIFYQTIRSLFRWARGRRMDPNAMETYDALTTIVRQLHNSLETPTNKQRH